MTRRTLAQPALPGYFNWKGYEVLVGSTGKEGLKKLQQEAVPVVISDVKLPDINGIKKCNQIKPVGLQLK